MLRRNFLAASDWLSQRGASRAEPMWLLVPRFISRALVNRMRPAISLHTKP